MCVCTEGQAVCKAMRTKYIEVSAALNHRTDELLVGIISQLRLASKRRQQLRLAKGGRVSGIGRSGAGGGGGGGGSPKIKNMKTAAKMVRDLFRLKPLSAKSYGDLLTM